MLHGIFIDGIPVFISLLPQIRCLITLRVKSSIISIDSNITDNITRKIINL